MSGPWKNQKNTPLDTFFPYISVDPTRWDKFFPYVLEVVDAVSGDVITSSGGKQKRLNIKAQTQVNANSRSVDATFSQEVWRIVLPISPQQISITDEFAISNTPTLRGILEEHNGIKYKNITMAGTTGTYPNRIVKSFQNVDSVKPTAIDQILQPSGTTDSLSDTVLKASKKKETDYNNSIDLNNTGYYHAQIFGQFLEQYALAKKNPNNASWRLVLRLEKENTSYFITPISFSLTKSVNKPNEYQYAFQAKAWKRFDRPKTNLAKSAADKFSDAIVKFPAAADSWRTIAAKNMDEIRSVRRDADSFFDSVRSTVVQAKNVINEVFDIVDMPAQLISDAKYSILDVISVANLIAQRSSNTVAKAKDAIDLSVLKNATSELGGFAAATSSTNPNSPFVLGSLDINPSTKIDPNEDYEALRGVPVSSLSLTEEQISVFEKDIETKGTPSVEDFRLLSNSIKSFAQDYAIKIGGGNSTTSTLYNKPTPTERAYPISLEENEFLVATYDFIQSIDDIIQTRTLDVFDIQSPMKFTVDTANEAGIDLEESVSKILVPVPFDLSIEEISHRYLGDRNRWLELVALNNLREPYIDETGFTKPLLSNGENRVFTVSSSEDLFQGQKISLASSTVPVFYRNISSITKLSETSYLIEVDGEADLDTLKLSEGAYMRGYLSGTVNSQDLIFIPSNTPVSTEDYPTITQTIKQNSLTQLSKVDFLLTDNYDIALDDSGDIRMSSGLTNLIQALKIKLMTEKGTLLNHPNFGLPVQVGSSTADFSASEVFKDIGEMILSDGRFSAIKSLKVTLESASLQISIQVELPNSMGVVPINFNIPR